MPFLVDMLHRYDTEAAISLQKGKIRKHGLSGEGYDASSVFKIVLETLTSWILLDTCWTASNRVWTDQHNNGLSDTKVTFFLRFFYCFPTELSVTNDFCSDF